MKFLHLKCGLSKIFEVFSSPVQAFLAITLVSPNATRIIHFKTNNNNNNDNNNTTTTTTTNNNNNNNDNNNISNNNNNNNNNKFFFFSGEQN